MKLITNRSNQAFFSEILDAAPQNITRVRAAVAYVFDTTLMAFCKDRNIPLRLWSRLAPGEQSIDLKILKSFVPASNLMSCRLIYDFHAKVIEFENYGFYIGSANLTKAAWNSNLEAGIWFSHEEAQNTGLEKEIKLYFDSLDREGYEVDTNLLNAYDLFATSLKPLQDLQKTQHKAIFSDFTKKYPRRTFQETALQSRTWHEALSKCTLPFAYEALDYFLRVKEGDPSRKRFNPLFGRIEDFKRISVRFTDHNLQILFVSDSESSKDQVQKIFEDPIEITPTANGWNVHITQRDELEKLLAWADFEPIR